MKGRCVSLCTEERSVWGKSLKQNQERREMDRDESSPRREKTSESPNALNARPATRLANAPT